MESKSHHKVNKSLLNISDSVPSHGNEYDPEEVLQTQSKLLETKADNAGPSYITLNSKK